jgi:hypothetical protein
MTKEIIRTEKIDEFLELDLFLENNIYFLLLRKTGDNPEEMPTIEINNDQATAENIFNEALKLGLIDINPNVLWRLITNKILDKLYGLPGIIPEELLK